jgi:hypothetical protein
LRIGAPAAENEEDALAEYFMHTDEFQRTARGENQIVSGRKGSGKTAMFVQLRAALRQDKSNIVLDLRPEGYQLRKFRDLVANSLSAGSRDHAITAFWEYLLLLEVCHKILQKDKQTHLADHTIYEDYRNLQAIYDSDGNSIAGDFAERMTSLLARLTDQFESEERGTSRTVMAREDITEKWYTHYVNKLRTAVFSYLSKKNGVWILIDNLDKGWPSHGVTEEDTLIIRCLLDAMFQMKKQFRKSSIDGFGVVFLRNDVYELLVDHTNDRGKLAHANIDWDDPDLLRELLRLRMTANDVASRELSFESVWGMFCVSHIHGEDSSQYVLDRCLMRPRALIELIGQCKSHAVNLNLAKIGESDFLRGEATYSSNLVTNISLEVRDILPEAEDLAYGIPRMHFKIESSRATALYKRRNARRIRLRKDPQPAVLVRIYRFGAQRRLRNIHLQRQL